MTCSTIKRHVLFLYDRLILILERTAVKYLIDNIFVFGVHLYFVKHFVSKSEVVMREK